ncbi:uncharacterized protein [Hetaerina americana]|uniref:uncharacterized protein isoform X2 n=1 Tax=Hetaerina americana TaxID=62018 RepID=UPI003A7F0F6E
MGARLECPPHSTNEERRITSTTESIANRIVASYNNRGLHDFDFYIKLPLLIAYTVSAALQSTMPITTKTSYIDYLPRVLFFEFTFLNAYIILNYHWWSKLKKTTKQLYGVIGCTLCITAGAIVILHKGTNADPGDIPISQANNTSSNGVHRKKHADTMASVGFLAFSAAILHSLDAIIGSY